MTANELESQESGQAETVMFSMLLSMCLPLLCKIRIRGHMCCTQSASDGLHHSDLFRFYVFFSRSFMYAQHIKQHPNVQSVSCSTFIPIVSAGIESETVTAD